jgi:8-oxo-dGTP diphosphatase
MLAPPAGEPALPTMSRNQRFGAYAICRNGSGEFLLVRASRSSNVPGRWFLPGGGIEHGEDPLDGLRREVAEETGLTVVEANLRGLLSDTWQAPGGAALHSIRAVYTVERWRGEPRPETVGSSDALAWVAREAVQSMPVMPYVRTALDRFG